MKNNICGYWLQHFQMPALLLSVFLVIFLVCNICIFGHCLSPKGKCCRDTSFVKHRHVFRRNLELSDECVKKCKVDIIHNNNSLISTKTPLLLYFFCDA